MAETTGWQALSRVCRKPVWADFISQDGELRLKANWMGAGNSAMLFGKAGRKKS